MRFIGLSLLSAGGYHPTYSLLLLWRVWMHVIALPQRAGRACPTGPPHHGHGHHGKRSFSSPHNHCANSRHGSHGSGAGTSGLKVTVVALPATS